MKKIIILLFIAITVGANANDSMCKIYVDGMNKQFKTLDYKVKNRIDIHNHEINMFKDSIASVYGNCDENTEYQKRVKSLIPIMQDSVCNFSQMIVGMKMSSIGRKIQDGINVLQYEVDAIRTEFANAENNCRGNTQIQNQTREKLKKGKTLLNSAYK